jgi:hypothetical protein
MTKQQIDCLIQRVESEKAAAAWNLSRARLYAGYEDCKGKPFNQYPSIESAIVGYSETLEWWDQMVASLKELLV